MPIPQEFCNMRLYLTCLQSAVNIDKVRIIKDVNILILKEPSSNFLLRCTSIELWDNDKFKSYDSELCRKLREKRYGVRKPIMSVEELP